MLHRDYVDGVSDRSLDYIVKRSCQMKFLFDYCKAEKRIGKFIEKYEKDNQEMFLDYRREDEYGNIIDPLREVEKQILEERGGYPSTWPWMM